MKIKQLVNLKKPSGTKTIEQIINNHIEIEGWIKTRSFLCDALEGTIKNFQFNYKELAEQSMASVQKLTEKYFEMEKGKPKLDKDGRPVLLAEMKLDDYTTEARLVLHKNVEWKL